MAAYVSHRHAVMSHTQTVTSHTPTLTFLLLLTFCGEASAARILMLPVDHTSHVTLFENVGDILRDSGHDVTILANARHKARLGLSKLKKIFIDTPTHVLQQDDKYALLEDSVMRNSRLGNIRYIWDMKQTISNQTDYLLGLGTTMDVLKKQQFDLAFVDGAPFAMSLYVVPYKLGIRYVTLSAFHFPWQVGLPALPSVETMQMKYSPRSPSFVQRLQALAFYIIPHIINRAIHWGDIMIQKHIPGSAVSSLMQLHDRSELWFINLENICLGSPRISASHYHFIGGIGIPPRNKLPADSQQFADSATSGLVVVTFGSGIKRIPNAILPKMLDTFRLLQQRVILRHDNAADDTMLKDLPSNVMILPWLPQNDLLGHHNAKLFVTHCGQNGQLEAIHHGVPMVGMPFWADQWSNAERMQEKGYGKVVNPHNFEVRELHETIKEVIGNPVYRESIQACSEILADLPSPKETVKVWTEHVLEFGSSHLKPVSLDIPLWRLFMLDILAVFLLSVHIVVIVTCKCCKCLRRGIRKTKIE